jgi:hypothetical protein
MMAVLKTNWAINLSRKCYVLDDLWCIQIIKLAIHLFLLLYEIFFLDQQKIRGSFIMQCSLKIIIEILLKVALNTRILTYSLNIVQNVDMI